MKELFDYFVAADTTGMSPSRWGATIVFSAYLLFFIYLLWKKGFRNLDILSLLLLLIVLFRSSYAIFLQSDHPNQTMRLLFFIFPVGMAVLCHFLFTTYKKYPREQMVIGFTAVLFSFANLIFGDALVPGSPHWWSDIYPLKLLNQAWLWGAILYSALVFIRLPAGQPPYSRFLRLANLALMIYLMGHFLLSLRTTDAMYFVYRYHSFVSDVVIAYVFGYLLGYRYRASATEAWDPEFDTKGVDIFAIMDRVPADKLIHYLAVNHPGSIPDSVSKLSPRQQLQAILMLHKVSIKESAEYSYVTPQAVKVYRSRIRKKLA